MKKMDKFGEWFFKKEHVAWNILFPFLLTGLIIWLTWLGGREKIDTFGYIFNFVLNLFLTFIAFNWPRFLLDEMSELPDEILSKANKGTTDIQTIISSLSEDIDKKMNRIDDLPHLMAFHTDSKELEKKIGVLQDLTTSSRWIYSKYISRILSVSFEDFKIKFSKTSQYSDFSSEMMRECSQSVYLTSSMTPHEWLYSLAIDENERKKYFRSVSKDIRLNESNHSKVLSGIPLKKKRVVCLSTFDYDHLFLFERSFAIYVEKNKGIDTFFLKIDNNMGDVKPLQYEYAMYDESLLFKFEKETRELEILKDGKEFEKLTEFFISNVKIGVSIENLQSEIEKKKTRLLGDIQTRNNQIPHKYSYLFHDNWTTFVDSSQRFGENARNAIADLIKSFDKHFSNDDITKIVEIGAGFGDKIDMVCDRIGTDNIASYTLIDISKPLINSSLSLLKNRFKEKQNKKRETICVDEKRFDFCDDNNGINNNLFHDKSVLILNNSTLFSEKNFPWCQLKNAKRIFITLDLYEQTKANDLYNEYCKARELFLSPLKIFGIPYSEELLKDDTYKDYFTDNRDEEAFSNQNPYYNIYFNLKKYIEDVNARNPLVLTDDSDIASDLEYKNSLKEFVKQEKIIALSSLKFKKCQTDDELRNDVQSFFQTKLGNNWNVYTNFAVNPDDTYIGICIEKKLQSRNASQRKKGKRKNAKQETVNDAATH